MIMEELLKHDEQTDVSDYQFADGDLSNFQEEFSIPKQDMGIEEEPDGDEWKLATKSLPQTDSNSDITFVYEVYERKVK